MTASSPARPKQNSVVSSGSALTDWCGPVNRQTARQKFSYGFLGDVRGREKDPGFAASLAPGNRDQRRRNDSKRHHEIKYCSHSWRGEGACLRQRRQDGREGSACDCVDCRDRACNRKEAWPRLHPSADDKGSLPFFFHSLLHCHHAPLLPTPWVCRGLRLDYLSCLGPSLVGSEFDVSLKVIFPHSLRFDHSLLFDHLLMQRAPRS